MPTYRWISSLLILSAALAVPSDRLYAAKLSKCIDDYARLEGQSVVRSELQKELARIKQKDEKLGPLGEGIDAMEAWASRHRVSLGNVLGLMAVLLSWLLHKMIPLRFSLQIV